MTGRGTPCFMRTATWCAPVTGSIDTWRSCDHGSLADESMTAWLDGLTFDTSAWGPAAEVEGLRWWRAETAMMKLRFVDMAPDVERLDVEYLRATMLEEMSLAEEHGWPLETIERLVTEGTMPPPPTQNGLIEVEIFRVQGVPLGAITTRQQVEGEIRFGTTLMVMFSTCFWTPRVEVQEPEPIGERECFNPSFGAPR